MRDVFLRPVVNSALADRLAGSRSDIANATPVGIPAAVNVDW
jgi:hypothetical protein